MGECRSLSKGKSRQLGTSPFGEFSPLLQTNLQPAADLSHPPSFVVYGRLYLVKHWCNNLLQLYKPIISLTVLQQWSTNFSK